MCTVATRAIECCTESPGAVSRPSPQLPFQTEEVLRVLEPEPVGTARGHRVQLCSEVYYTTSKSMHIPEYRCDPVTLLIIKPMIAENHVCICFRV